MKSRTIKVDVLARVEGEGALYVKLKGNTLAEVKLRIYEPPRFFEAFMRGRDYTEAPDITARICGICPVAYQMSSVHAMENLAGVHVEGPIRELRRLLYCGEWIESHVLHIAMLHAPDFLGYPDALQMAKDHPDIVKTALRLKKIGNEIMALLGGREIHPINVRVGGFYRVPDRQELQPVAEKLKWARDTAQDLVRWTAGLPFPDFERDYEFVALSHPTEYPLNEGRLISNKGLDIPVADYEKEFSEEHLAHSNALHSVLKKRGAYVVGPLARFALNFSKLSPIAQEAAQSAGLSDQCRNPFRSIIIRAVETLYACDEALRIIASYQKPDKPVYEVPPKAGVGFGCTEAPRGILFNRYQTDDIGKIVNVKIVPPTSQNQRSIEEDLWKFIPPRLELSDEKLTLQCEQAIRNYDPCISCATHFLKLKINRE
ncbi:MAG: Ni/Fe hydrogenase subunit alpha [Terriglobia bacterium]